MKNLCSISSAHWGYGSQCRKASARLPFVLAGGMEISRSHRRSGFDPWVGKTPWRRKWQPTPVFLPGRFHRQRSLTGFSPYGHKESDTTEQLSLEITWIISERGRRQWEVGPQFGKWLRALFCSWVRTGMRPGGLGEGLRREWIWLGNWRPEFDWVPPHLPHQDHDVLDPQLLINSF